MNSSRRDARDGRTRLIEATIGLLESTGPGSVKAREVASAAGLSATTVYNAFGGMPELLAATADEGYRRLEGALASVEITDDPVSDLFVMGLACRETALRNPHLYDLMFGLSTRGSYRAVSSDETVLSGRSTTFHSAYAHFVAACARLVASPRVRSESPGSTAAQIWSFMHGFTALEIAGHFEALDDPVNEVLLPLAQNVMVGLGDDVGGALTSALAAFERHAQRVASAEPQAAGPIRNRGDG